MMTQTSIPRLMLVTDRLRADRPIVDVVRMAVAGGVDAIQIREKDLPAAELSKLALTIQEAVGQRAAVLVNGSLAIARDLGIGLHLPESVETSEVDRSILPPGALIGRSVHSVESARESGEFDYLIAGHVFETGSKAGLPVLGLTGLAEIVTAAACSVIAIGGITPDRVKGVIAAGAAGIAVMSGICSSNNPEGAARAYKQALNGASMPDSRNAGDETIDIQVNGKSATLKSGMTISDFLELKGLHPNMVVVEHNGHILKKGEFASATIRLGDVLEVVHFVGGG